MRKKIFDKINKKILCGILLIACIICTLVSNRFPQEVVATLNFGSHHDEPIGPLFSNDVIEMDMPSEISSDCVMGLELEIATYNKFIETGKLLAQLVDKNSNEILAESFIRLENTEDNIKRTIIFDEHNGISNDYLLRLKVVEMVDGIAIWLDKGVDYKVKYNDSICSGIINAKLIYKSSDDPWTWQLVIVTLIVLLIFVLISKKERCNEKE